MSAALDLSTRTIKIYASAFDATARAAIDAHVADNDNPHDVTATQIGLGNVDNTADADKPISAAGAAAIAAANDDIAGLAAELDAHTASHANPHTVTAAQVGLGLVDNTADASKPVSTAQQTAIDGAAAVGDAAQSAIDAHKLDHVNPHIVTKSQVGLGSVDNTTDALKPVSGPQQTAINGAAAVGTAAQTSIDAHKLDHVNPHQVTKTQIGLGNVDNTTDANKPVSGPQSAALALKAPLASPALTGTPTAPTPPIDDVSTQLATTAFVQHVANDTATDISAVQAELDAHEAAVNNPHAVTKAQVGLGNVDNTADLAKPISTATQAALNQKAYLDSPHFTGVPTVPDVVPTTDTNQIASTHFVHSLIQAINLGANVGLLFQTPSLLAGQPHRPGDAIGLYGESLDGQPADATLLDEAWAVVGPQGTVARVAEVNDQIIAPIAATALEPGRVYEIRWRVQRLVDPVDPLGDSVTLGIVWLANNKGIGSQVLVQNIALVAANGVVERSVRVANSPAPITATVDYVAPANTIYFRPYIQMFGGSHITDAITLDVRDVTPIRQALPTRVESPTSGATITLNDLRPVAIMNAAVLPALTIKLPAYQTSGDLIEVWFRSSVTVLTVQDNGGNPVSTAPHNAYGPGAAIQFRYIAPGYEWVLWK